MTTNRQDQFNQDIDAMLHEQQTSMPPDGEYAELLAIARHLTDADFSADSRVRNNLRQRLLSSERRNNRPMLVRDTIPTPYEASKRTPLIGALVAVLMLVGFAAFAFAGYEPSSPQTDNPNFGASGSNEPDANLPAQQASATLPPNATVTPSLAPTSSPISVTATPIPGRTGNSNDGQCQFANSQFEIGQSGYIATDDELLLPSTQAPSGIMPDVSARSLGRYEYGTAFEVVANPYCVEGLPYLYVRMEDGQEGWIAETTLAYTVVPFNSEVEVDIEATCDTISMPQLAIGEAGRITFSINVPYRLRSEPSTFSEPVATYPSGLTFVVVDGPVCVEEQDEAFVFYEVVMDEDGTQGWLMAIFDGAVVLEQVED